jgi:predicted dinucleotide-binding enzyme
MSSKKERITIIGTGNYAISISKQFLHFGYDIVFGSRRPDFDYIQENLYEYDENRYEVLSIVDAWSQSEGIVILAIGADLAIYDNLVNKIVQHMSKNKTNRAKIVIEISNTVYSEHSISNAERLENAFREKLSEIQSKPKST